MENFALITLAGELRREARDIVIRRVAQHQRRGVLLQTRTTRLPAIKFLVDPRTPTVYISNSRPPAEHPPGEFVLVLRKHLVGARLEDLRKPLSERILEFDFRTALPARELERVILVAELFPNAANLLLLDSERHLIAAFNPLAADRRLPDYEPYAYPPQTKIDLAEAANRNSDRSWFDAAGFDADPEGWLVRHVAGVGPVLASELVRRQADSGAALPEVLANLVDALHQRPRTAWLYTRRPLAALMSSNDMETLRRSVLSPIALRSLDRSFSEQTFPGLLEAMRSHFDLLEERTLLDAAKAPYLRKLRMRRKRAIGHRRRLEERRNRFEQATRDRESAELVVSSGLDLGSRRPHVEVMDYSDGSGRQRTITLDPALTIRENATKLFRAHRKAERGLRLLGQQSRDAELADHAIADEERRIRAIGDWNAWHAFLDRSPGSRIAEGGSHGRRASPEVRSKARPRRGRSLTIRGREILIGRNSRENDELTFQVATGDDFWLHAADYSGSHVIVRNPSRDEELEEDILVRAAELAAYHSQARNSPKVHVHYTRRKFVKKPRRAKPGLVLLREFRTVTVEPRNWTGAEPGTEVEEGERVKEGRGVQEGEGVKDT